MRNFTGDDEKILFRVLKGFNHFGKDTEFNKLVLNCYHDILTEKVKLHVSSTSTKKCSCVKNLSICEKPKN